jgi:hypothetical protein
MYATKLGVCVLSSVTQKSWGEGGKQNADDMHCRKELSVRHTHTNRRGATFSSKTFACRLNFYKANHCNGDVISSLLVVAYVSFHAGP